MGRSPVESDAQNAVSTAKIENITQDVGQFGFLNDLDLTQRALQRATIAELVLNAG